MRRLGIHALNIALVALCSFQSAEVVNLIATDTLTPPPAYEARAATVVAETRSDWEARQAILERNLFGAKIAGEVVVMESIVEEKVEETKLPLVLEATIFDSNAGDSRAAIHDTRERVSMVLSVGDPVENYDKVTIALIERGRVLLKNSGRYEELLLEEGTGVSSSSSGSTAEVSAAARRSRASRSARRPSSRSRTPARSPAAERVRELQAENPDAELTLDDITAEIEKMRQLQE